MTYLFSLLRFLLTLLVLAVAVFLGLTLWNRYMYAPWTRDGRVRADVVTVASDVSGLVTEVPVHDNQFVHQGDVLFIIDQSRFQLAVRQAEALVAARKAEVETRKQEAARRKLLEGTVVSAESRETSSSAASVADAQYREAQAQLDTARLNLDRTQVKAPADGYVTNLAIFAGNYASAGHPVLAVIESKTFYVYGYFEETKLPTLREGQKVRLQMMSGGPDVLGHIESLARGIGDRENPTGSALLADVNPTFNWVRLAQRVPVRIAIDTVPAPTVLSVGMTCTVIVDAPPPPPVWGIDVGWLDPQVFHL